MSSLREAAVRHRHGHEAGFHWRGREVSRLEGLSDAVFAFAITLLVISLEVPTEIHEMVVMMRGFVAFIFSFLLIYRLWTTQYRFFRRYGLEDSTTITLNGVLLFLVLFFVYPLKFLTALLTRWVSEHSLAELRPHLLKDALITGDGRALVLFYFWGSSAVLATLGLMYLHAYRRRHDLELTPHEAHLTRQAYRRLFLGAAMPAVAPLGLLTAFTPYRMLGATVEYVVLGAVAVAVVALRRRASAGPSMDEAYVRPGSDA